MNDPYLTEQLFGLIGYLLTSAHGSFSEPHEYGSFRLIEGASKVCSLLENEDTKYGDFFIKLKGKLDENKFLMMTDMDVYTKAIEECVLYYTQKAMDEV